ncbi:MAG TPA: T9SS type A sorting domain-containing protein, partial [Bacteroidales bacterium]|nr:T9SS type A sorting domain-containing protein [Bacteroidales bacterium]
IDAGVFRSDPVLGCDAQGTFYYNSLTVLPGDEFVCTVYKTGDGTVEWDDGTFAYGGDKQWMVIDKTEGEGAGHNYSFWTKSWSYCYPNFFTRSSNLGVSFEPCVSVAGEPYWGTLAVGPNGELYIAGAGESDNIMLTKSVNAEIPGSDISWVQYSAVDLGGYVSGWTPVNPQGLLGQVWVDVDVSGGPGHGNVYVVASVVRPMLDAADVMIARSTDGGLTFDAPVRINDDPDNTRYQWFGTMSVAPNGRIDVVWLDTRVDMSNGVMSALFYSYSTDQGETWSVNKQLTDPFDPHVGWPQQQKMGDYFHMISDEGGANLAWANTLNGEQDVYYAYIEPEAVGINEQYNEKISMSVSNYPNPFAGETTIRYTLGSDCRVKLLVYDIIGNEVMELREADEKAGIHTCNCDLSELPAGVYIGRLYAGDSVESVRLVKTGK